MDRKNGRRANGCEGRAASWGDEEKGVSVTKRRERGYVGDVEERREEEGEARDGGEEQVIEPRTDVAVAHMRERGEEERERETE